jgi:hypothetical protein
MRGSAGRLRNAEHLERRIQGQIGRNETKTKQKPRSVTITDSHLKGKR